MPMTLLALTLGWLGLLFALARLAEAREAFRRLSTHPLVYSLSLGVYATSWTFLGAVGLAREQGLTFLAVSVGPLLSAMLVPALWLPLLRVLKRNQLATVADLFAFRYRSQALGFAVALTMVLGIIPYLAVQVRSVAHTTRMLAPHLDTQLVGLAFCGVMVVFATLFGARHAAATERHPGLVVAIAFESTVKLLALLAVGVAVLWREGLPSPSAAQVEQMVEPVRSGGFITVLLLSVAAPFLLPRQFHMAFTEAPEGEAGERGLRTATWAFPTFLLLMNLPIPLVLWAGERLAPDGNADLYVLTVVARSPLLQSFAWLGGVSAASAMVIVSTLALSSMSLTHLVLPFQPMAEGDVYGRLRFARRVAVATLLAMAYLTFLALEQRIPSRGGTLAHVGLVSFAAVLQLVPGLTGVLFFPRANRSGVLAGLLVGVLVWLLLLALPLVGVVWVPLPEALTAGDALAVPALLSLSANVIGAVLGSHWSAQTPEEREAAARCRSELAPVALGLLPESVEGFVDRLSTVLGRAAARVEVEDALSNLKLTREERRPAQLETIRTALEARLTGLMGPVLSHAALRTEPPSAVETATPLAERLRLLEAEVELAAQRGHTSAAEALQAWQKAVFASLPVGVAVLGPQGEVAWWNRMMELLSGLPLEEVLGRPLQGRLGEALKVDGEHRWEVEASDGSEPGEVPPSRTWRVSSAILDGAPALPQGRVVVVEDLSAQRTLEARVAHQDRLASIGQLAAGVAHEVGNPLSAILMVAQNLLREKAPNDVPERLSLIVSEALRIDGIVKTLLTFSRTGRASRERRTSQVSLGRAVASAVTLCRLARRRDFVVEVPADGPWVEGVESELVQVVVNLLNNASDATPQGRSIRVWAAEAEGGSALGVEDEGAGMSEDVRRHLFEPFFTTKDPGGGTGLGMSIVESLVQAHGGRILVDSAPGRGTRLTLRFPASEGGPRWLTPVPAERPRA
jgi:signal transduction histidine kinase/Na+/proline symporter